MIRNIKIYCFLIALLLSGTARAQSLDTAAELRQIGDQLRNFKNSGYDYTMEAQFPNGEKDQVKGYMYVNNEDKLLYNDCDAFTMIYSDHWLYKADHRKKTIDLVGLDKKDNKALKKSVEKDVFQNGATNPFLDSLVLKNAKIIKLKKNGDTVSVTLVFPKSKELKRMEIVYDGKNNSPVSYYASSFRQLQSSSKAVEGTEMHIHCSNFKIITDKSLYAQDRFFSYTNGKVELKKYNNYKLSTKM